MRDRDIRKMVRAEIEARHPEDDKRVYDELGLCCGAARVDIGLVNGSLEGFEIKSAHDTLRRLPFQAEVYGRVFDRVTIVASDSHIDSLQSEIPDWWGIWRAVESGDEARLIEERSARANPKRDAFSIAQLLWRDELLEILESEGIADGVKSKSKKALQARIADRLDVDRVADLVRVKLKCRDWRAD